MEVPEIGGREPGPSQNCAFTNTPTRLAGSRSGRQETNGKFWNIIHVMVVLLPHGVQFAEVTFQPGLFITP